ncbi:MAG: nitroreductase family protein [Chloroflexi bacterium]|nr:nitroreductase family protein [Chloroflexota bacterium]
MATKMDFDSFLAVVRSRRSCRAFKPDPIPEGYVEKIIETARWAMSGANGQPWEFIIVKDQAMKDRIAELFIGNRERVYNIERTRVEDLRMPAYRDRPDTRPALQTAPVVIVIVGDRRTVQASVLYSNFVFGEGGPGAVYQKNMANATHLLQLGAAALGLGAQWCSVNSSWEDSLKRLLDVPEELQIPTLIPVGYPDGKPAPPFRRKLKEVLHYGKYDRSRYRSGEEIFEFIKELRRRTREAYARGI